MRYLLGIILLCGVVGCSSERRPVFDSALIITNGTIIDGTGAEPVPDGIVVIRGERIVAVGRVTDFSIPSETRIIDARGGTILPGIVDSHVHNAADPGLRRDFLIDGVTTVCDLGSPLYCMPIFEEERIGQDLVARGFRAGPIITAPGGLPDAVLREGLNYEVATPDEARAAVADLVDRGADVIKIYFEQEHEEKTYPLLGVEEVQAIVQEAHSRGVPVRAHVTFASFLGLALDTRVDVLEHVPIPELSEAEIQTIVETGEAPPLLEFEAQLARAAEQGIVMVPTLDRPYGALYRDPDPHSRGRILAAAVLEIVGAFHASGGVVALGTDYTTDIGMARGMPVGEMKLLLEAGLTPMEVIEAGTKHAAHVCGHGDELGTLEPGKLADVIIVEGDPLIDIEAMGRVVTVVKGGEVAFVLE